MRTGWGDRALKSQPINPLQPSRFDDGTSNGLVCVTKMRRTLSTYLDLLRFCAAVAVFFSHIGWTLLTGGFLWQLQFIGADAVVVFFVLSGFVIQYAADTKEKTLIEYQIARLARLYSVVVPALVLAYVFDRVGIAHNPAVYPPDTHTNLFLGLAAGLTFLAQCWTWDYKIFSNNPFWSLCYEFWYYQLFAAAIFFKGRTRVALIAVICLIIGPPILIYLPLWLSGVAAYRLSKTVKPGPRRARIIFFASSAAVALLIWLDAKGFARGGGGLLPRNFTPMDYLLACAVAINIYSASFLQLPFGALAKPITTCAGITFALYLLHLPILHLIAAYTPTGLSPPVRAAILIIGAVPIVVLLSLVSERRKHEWRRFFRWLLNQRRFQRIYS